MKKIISALAMGALVATATFADVSVNLNFRQRANMYATASGDNTISAKGVVTKGTKTDESYAFFTDAYSGSGSDNLAISLSGDIVSFDMQWVADAAKTNGWRAKGYNASVFLGPVTVFGGLWADGKQNGAYRNKTLIDAGNFEGMDFEWHKMGSGYKNVPDNWIDNMVGAFGNLPENFAAGVSYKVPGIDNGALTLNATYITNETSSTYGADVAFSKAKHTYGFVADGRIDGLGQAELAVKYGDWGQKRSKKSTDPEKNDDYKGEMVQAIGAGLYVMPTTIKNLFTTIGGSIGVIDGNFEDYSAELRLHYVVKPNKFTITSFHSFSALTDAENFEDYQKDDRTDGSKGANVPIRSLADYSIANGNMKGAAIIQRDAILSNNIGVRYFVTPSLAVTGIVADMVGLGKDLGQKVIDKDGKETTDAIVQVRASLWAQFYADKNNSVSIGCVYAINDVTDTFGTKVSAMSIPVIFRVKM